MDVKVPIKLNVTVEELDKDGNIIKQAILKEEDVEFFFIEKEDSKNGSIRKNNDQ
jgi:hypothetical protein